MDIKKYWPLDVRIIEFDPPCGGLGERLLGAGYSRYLAVAPNRSHLMKLAKRCLRLDSHVAVSRDAKRLRQNNADVLVLHDWLALRTARFRDIRHARYVALPLPLGAAGLLGFAFGLVQFLLGRFALPRIVDCGRVRQSTQRLVVFRIRRPQPHAGVRRFVPHSLGVAGFFRTLSSEHIRHAVLRWFESMPELPPGEDVDLLVDDERLAEVREFTDSGPGLQAVDVYSTHGALGADYCQLPYFPPYLAEQILDKSVIQNGLCQVPAPREHFLSLAYHALYHKGFSSGLPIDGTTQSCPTGKRQEHDYAHVLGRLAAGLGLALPMTLAALDAYLDSQGWRPPHDMLARLGHRNAWVRSLVENPGAKAADHGLAVFLMRREALSRGGVDKAAAMLTDAGFQILETISLDGPLAKSVARCVRGGNWGRGPYRISGGPPVAAIVAYDLEPLPPSRQHLKEFPLLGNARLRVKTVIRDEFNAGIPDAEHCNVVHSSDNGREALDYLRFVAPEKAGEILDRVRALRERPAGRRAA